MEAQINLFNGRHTDEPIGTSLVTLVPTDDNVLIKATAFNSREGFVAGTQDEKEKFTYTVAGFGYKVTDLILGDVIKVLTHSLNKVSIDENKTSFESIVNSVKSLNKKDIEKFLTERSEDGSRKIEFTEYLLCNRYAIIAILPKDPFRNAFNVLTSNANNISDNSDNK